MTDHPQQVSLSHIVTYCHLSTAWLLQHPAHRCCHHATASGRNLMLSVQVSTCTQALRSQCRSLPGLTAARNGFPDRSTHLSCVAMERIKEGTSGSDWRKCCDGFEHLQAFGLCIDTPRSANRTVMPVAGMGCNLRGTLRPLSEAYLWLNLAFPSLIHPSLDTH